MHNRLKWLYSELKKLKEEREFCEKRIEQEKQNHAERSLQVELKLKKLGYVCTDCVNYRPVGLYWTPSCCAPCNESNWVERSQVTGEYPVPCADMRRPYEICGPEGKLFSWGSQEIKDKALKKVDMFYDTQDSWTSSAQYDRDRTDRGIRELDLEIWGIEGKIRKKEEKIKSLKEWFLSPWVKSGR